MDIDLLNGSRAIAHAMQSDMKEGVVLVDRSHRRPRPITPVAARPEIPVAESTGPVPLAMGAPRLVPTGRAPVSKGPADAATLVSVQASVRTGGASR